jgi:hypothetical protein
VSGSAPLTDEWIQERLRHWGVEAPEAPVVWDDTTNYMGIDRKSVV